MPMNLFGKKQASKNEAREKEKFQFQTDFKPGECLKILTMGGPIIFPQDLMEGLGCAAVCASREPHIINISDVELYSLYNVFTGKFVGSFWAIEYGGAYLGNVIGSADIIACTEKSFRINKANTLEVPVKRDKTYCYMMLCRYDKENASVEPFVFKWVDLITDQIEIIQDFPEGTSMDEALEYCFDFVK